MAKEKIDTNFDFDLKDEYKPEPLILQGNYTANTIAVVLDIEHHCIVWKIALDGNGGVMSDGETAVDGAHLYFRNWLPTKGDENEMSANGRSTKRQSKVNMLTRFSEDMKLDMNSIAVIQKAIEDQDWIGIPVNVKISISEYQGNVRNEVNNMTQFTD